MYHQSFAHHWGPLNDRTEVFDFVMLKELIPYDFFYGINVWGHDRDLPTGFTNYLVMMEGCNVDWLIRQSVLMADRAKIFVLGLYRHYDYFQDFDNVIYLPWLEWHYQARRMYQAYGAVQKQVTHRISAMASRITHNKIVAFMTLLQQQDCLLAMGTHLISKNVHDWQSTGRPRLDQLIQQYRQDWQGKSVRIDHYDPQIMTSDQAHDYAVPAYINCAMNVNNESSHYSQRNGHQLPGPFLTEKTLKCWLSGTACLHNGQFDTYSVLRELGFEFDYGIDLSYDNIPGDLDRMIAMLELLDNIKHLGTQDICQLTADSNKKNQHHVIEGDFYDRCEQINQASLKAILEQVS